MAKTQPKIDDIKDLKKATDVSDGLMSKEDKEKLDDLVGVNTGDEDTTTIGSLINGATAKATPADDDMVGLMDSDSTASNLLKKLSWSNIKATLKTYFDTLYARLSFASIKVGAENVDASRDSTVEFIAGTNVSLTADNDAKTITIAATGGGGGGGIQTVTLASGTDAGTLKLTVDGDTEDNIPVEGLGSAAYEATSAFATAAQGDLANSSLQPIVINDLLNDYLPKWDDTNNKFIDSLISDDGTTPKYGANKIWHSGNVGSNDIKEGLGLTEYNYYNKQDIFISGLPTYSTDFNAITYIGSYKVSGGYSNAPNPDCGTNTTSITASMKGSLNVFRSGVNDWETIQQLFWVLNRVTEQRSYDVTEQYQRSYDGTTWTDWKRLIKCDDYANPSGTGRGGIISAANISELFRAPGLIQLWNETGLELSDGVFHLDDFSIGVPIQNSLYLGGSYDNDIVDLVPERRYRVTYEVHCVKKKGEGLIFIRIENDAGELYSIGDYIFDWAIRKSYRFSVILTNTDVIRPSIEVDSRLTIEIYNYNYQVSVEEIKFPQFNPA